MQMERESRARFNARRARPSEYSEVLRMEVCQLLYGVVALDLLSALLRTFGVGSPGAPAKGRAQ